MEGYFRFVKIGITVTGMTDMRFVFFFSSRRRHTRFDCDWSSDVCSSDLAELLSLRHETVARIIETRARAEEDRNLARLYRTSIVPQAQAAVQTSLASYRVGRLSFMQLIDNQMTVNQYQTETYRLVEIGRASCRERV